MPYGPPWFYERAGRFDEHTFVSEALRDNALGDPHERPLWVYVPPGYDDDRDRRYATVYVIQGLAGQLDMWRNRRPFGEKNYPELADELFAGGDAPPCILVWVDAWTSYGGSQFVDSPAVGRYHTYLCDEVVPWVDANYRTLAAREHRGIQGKSSGGYGAMVTPMLRPDLFGALATHAGDALFEVVFPPDFREAARAIREEYGGSYERFWEDFRSRRAFDKRTDAPLMNVWAMAACYSAEADGTVTLPFELETGELRPDVWERWLACDPVRMARRSADALRKMVAIYIDAGKRDEYFLDLGAIAFRNAVTEAGAPDVFFEIIDATHGNLTPRYPIALRYLAERLSVS